MKCWYVPDTIACRQMFELDVREALPEVLTQLTTSNKTALTLYLTKLKLVAYSPSTVQTYHNKFLQLLITFKEVDVNSLSQQWLGYYFILCHDELKLSKNTIISRLNAIKFYFKKVLKGEIFFWSYRGPKKN